MLAKCTASSVDLLSSDVRPTKRRKRRVIGMAGARSFSSRRCNTGRIRRNIPASCAKRTAGNVDLLSIDAHRKERRRRAMRTAAGRSFSIRLIDGSRSRKRKRRAMRTAAARSFSIRAYGRESNEEAEAPRYANASGQIVQHPAGCPARLFCGCGASIEAFGRSIRDLWLVSNWYRFPRTAPAAGMAVLWGTRHVAIIRQYNGDGTAVLYDANSGKGLTRVHRVRIAGLAVVDPHPGRTLPTPSPLMVIL